MTDQFNGSRVLIYSHDTFGLGHLRRCRTIAHALVECYSGLSVLILSGSPIIGSFDFRTRVDFVRIPGVIKLRNGEYTSLGLHIDLEDTVRMRASIIQHTAQTFAPDLFIVDKEPLGFKGEIRETLMELRRTGTRTVLGLREVMDAPGALRAEWAHKKVPQSLESLYDEIWIYGPPEMGDPLEGVPLSSAARQRMVYTGYLPRTIPTAENLMLPEIANHPFLLVTPGGGGDGEIMLDWVLRAYEKSSEGLLPSLLVLGPFMPLAKRQEFVERADRLADVHAITFDSHIEILMERAAGIVAMGGYNTFCEILSMDKPSLLLPRCVPREEQLIRAQRAQALGLTRMLSVEKCRDVDLMREALRTLPDQGQPSLRALDKLLASPDTLCALTSKYLSRAKDEALAVGQEIA